MNESVAIVGVGWSGFRPVTPDVSYKELMYEAAVRAYADARVIHAPILRVSSQLPKIFMKEPASLTNILLISLGQHSNLCIPSPVTVFTV